MFKTLFLSVVVVVTISLFVVVDTVVVVVVVTLNLFVEVDTAVVVVTLSVCGCCGCYCFSVDFWW